MLNAWGQLGATPGYWCYCSFPELPLSTHSLPIHSQKDSGK